MEARCRQFSVPRFFWGEREKEERGFPVLAHVNGSPLSLSLALTLSPLLFFLSPSPFNALYTRGFNRLAMHARTHAGYLPNGFIILRQRRENLFIFSAEKRAIMKNG